MNFEDLTPEQREKVAACKTPEEILALAKSEGVELTEEQLEEISGGDAWGEISTVIYGCPYCGDGLCLKFEGIDSDTGKRVYYCESCHSVFHM